LASTVWPQTTKSLAGWAFVLLLIKAARKTD
jgi:hypothetical protein